MTWILINNIKIWKVRAGWLTFDGLFLLVGCALKHMMEDSSHPSGLLLPLKPMSLILRRFLKYSEGNTEPFPVYWGVACKLGGRSSHEGSPMRKARCTTQSMMYCQKSGLRELGERECCGSTSYRSSVLVLSPCRRKISLISNCWINTVFSVSFCPVLFPAGCWHNGREGTS